MEESAKFEQHQTRFPLVHILINGGSGFWFSEWSMHQVPGLMQDSADDNWENALGFSGSRTDAAHIALPWNLGENAGQIDVGPIHGEIDFHLHMHEHALCLFLMAWWHLDFASGPDCDALISAERQSLSMLPDHFALLINAALTRQTMKVSLAWKMLSMCSEDISAHCEYLILLLLCISCILS